jgi:hypothetical protein
MSVIPAACDVIPREVMVLVLRCGGWLMGRRGRGGVVGRGVLVVVKKKLKF